MVIKVVSNKFLSMTTIPAICHIRNSSTRWEKVLWMLLFATGFALCCYEFHEIVQVYHRFAVIETRRIELQTPLKFPTVTVCVNNPITNIQRMARDNLRTEQDFLNLMSTWNVRERIEAGYEEGGFVMTVNYALIKINKSVMTNNLYYGNCYSYDDDSIHSQVTEMQIIMETPVVGNKTEETRSRNVLVMVHEPGTAPLPSSAKTITLFPGNWIDVSVSKTDYVRLPSPYTSHCIDRNSSFAQWKSIHYKPENPYLYTLEDCLQNCLYNLTIQYCHCILPKLQFRDNEERLPLCTTACIKIPDFQLQNGCGCKEPCSNSVYNSIISQQPGKLNTTEFARAMTYALQTRFPINVMQALIRVLGVCVISVELSPFHVESITEEQSLTIATLLGSIGGIMGAWIGISVIQLFEIISVALEIGIELCSKRNAVQ